MGSGGARQARQSCRDRGERAVAHVTAERPSPLRLPGPLLPSRLRPPAPSGAGGRARQRRRRRPRPTRGRPRQVRRRSDPDLGPGEPQGRRRARPAEGAPEAGPASLGGGRAPSRRVAESPRSQGQDGPAPRVPVPPTATSAGPPSL